MTDTTLSTSWPAAPSNGSVVIRHPAWEEARNTVLDLAAEGPVTVFLSGQLGSGKTWLLRELAASLSGHGFPTMALLRGDLPIPLGDGVAVLVDEASYMPDRTRAELAVQDRGVVVLADIEPSAMGSAGTGRKPVHVHLRLLTADEIGLFAADWLRQEGLPSAILDPNGLSRLAEQSGGAVRLVTQLLTAATALTQAGGHLRITGALIDQVAAFRLGTSMPDMVPDIALDTAPLRPILPVPLPPAAAITRSFPIDAFPVDTFPVDAPAAPLVKRIGYRWALAGTALAACVLAMFVVPGVLNRAPAVSDHQAPILAAIPALPPLRMADVPPPSLTVSADSPMLAGLLPAPMLEPISPPAVQPPILPPSAPASFPVASLPVASVPEPIIALSSASPSVPLSAPNPVAMAPAIDRPAVAGLVLIAQRGDTLERLYADIYRDRHAPPFAVILAANPTPFKPGAVIVFPEPIGGWGRAQR